MATTIWDGSLDKHSGFGNVTFLTPEEVAVLDAKRMLIAAVISAGGEIKVSKQSMIVADDRVIETERDVATEALTLRVSVKRDG